MDRRSVIAAIALSLGGLSIGYALFSPESDEERIEAQLNALAAALSFSEPISNPVFFASHLSDEFEDLLSENVQVQISELQSQIPASRSRLALLAAQALSRYGSLDLSFSDLQIKLQGEQAEVRALVKARGNDGGALRGDSRRIHFEFDSSSGDFLITQIVVTAEEAQ